MPLKIELKVEGSDREVFVVRGLSESGPEVLIAVQRLDDQRYLTVHRLWDTAPSWHPCARVGGDSVEGVVRFAATPSLAAGIRATARVQLQAHLRRGELSDLGPLVALDSVAPDESVIPKQLQSDPASGPESVPSVPPADPAAIDSPFEDPAITHAPRGNSDGYGSPEPKQNSTSPHAPVLANSELSDLTWSAAPPPVATLPPEPAIRAASVERQSDRPPARTSRWLALLVVVLVVLAVLGMGIRALVWKSAPDGGSELPARAPKLTPAPVPQVKESHRPEPAPTPPRPPERPIQQPGRTPTSPSGASGKALYLELKGQNLPPQDLFDRGEQADRSGDCEASIRLLIDAAKRAPGLAERLARRYDPEGFEPTPCFPQAKPDSAMVWYQNAAEQDIPAAQRRYGELLLGEATSGPIYQDAVEWLRKAATAGDAAAAKRLETLGER